MGFYNDHILPHLIGITMRGRDFAPYRERLVSQAEGRVLEIGVGSGANFPFYPNGVREIVGLDPSPRLLSMAEVSASSISVDVSFVNAPAESIPMDSGSFDHVVLTWTLCSVSDPAKALAEVRRVLKPTGRLLLVEHGLAPERSVQQWQRRLTPLWKRLAGGCHLNRCVPALIEDAGLKIQTLDTGYMRRPRPMTYQFEGSARR